MTVADYIEELKKLPQDLPVCFGQDEDYPMASTGPSIIDERTKGCRYWWTEDSHLSQEPFVLL